MVAAGKQCSSGDVRQNFFYCFMEHFHTAAEHCRYGFCGINKIMSTTVINCVCNIAVVPAEKYVCRVILTIKLTVWMTSALCVIVLQLAMMPETPAAQNSPWGWDSPSLTAA